MYFYFHFKCLIPQNRILWKYSRAGTTAECVRSPSSQAALHEKPWCCCAEMSHMGWKTNVTYNSQQLQPETLSTKEKAYNNYVRLIDRPWIIVGPGLSLPLFGSADTVSAWRFFMFLPWCTQIGSTHFTYSEDTTIINLSTLYLYILFDDQNIKKIYYFHLTHWQKVWTPHILHPNTFKKGPVWKPERSQYILEEQVTLIWSCRAFCGFVMSQWKWILEPKVTLLLWIAVKAASTKLHPSTFCCSLLAFLVLSRHRAAHCAERQTWRGLFPSLTVQRKRKILCGLKSIFPIDHD